MRFLALLVCGILSAWPVAAQTNQTWRVCRNPVRVFDTGSANLAPLFQWWTRQPPPSPSTPYTNAVLVVDTNNPDGDRPLAAWHRVTGLHAGTLASGSWVVEAVIYTSPTARTNTRVILNHPPAVEEQAYLTLQAELAQASAQITNAEKTYQADKHAAQQDEARANEYRHAYHKFPPPEITGYSRAAAQMEASAKAAAEQQQQLTATREELEKKLKGVPARDGHYQIDWFAVQTGFTKAGVPIYDLGLVSATPP